MFAGKKVIILGDRDGIPSLAIEECIRPTGAEIVFSATECFVWTAAGAMDLENQARVKSLAEKYGAENLIVILGSAEAEASGLTAETVINGDPTFAGPLAGVQLGLNTFHIMEDLVKQEIDPEIYEEQIGMMEMVLDVEGIKKEMEQIRSQFAWTMF